MPLIFIDSNIYLDPYRRVMKNYRKLLRSLIEISDFVFVTQIVRDEVERNRVSAYRDNNKPECPKIRFSLPELFPHHAEGEADIDAINRKIRQLDNYISRNSKEIFDEMLSLHERNITSILRGEDDVSTTLKPLLDRAIREEEPQIQRARLRKERGQPPGKKADPLGDQVSWEQILESAQDKGNRSHSGFLGVARWLSIGSQRIFGLPKGRSFDSLGA